MNRKTVMPVAVLLVICLAVTALVACVNAATKDTISQNQDKSDQAAMESLIPDAQFEPVERSFSTGNITNAYRAVKNGSTVGYIICSEGEGGYGGNIPVITALDETGIVIGLQITVDDETPGLGQNAAKEEFRNQYIGKETEVYTVTKGEPSAAGEIQAIASATKTSQGVTDAVNRAKAAYRELIGGEGK